MTAVTEPEKMSLPLNTFFFLDDLFPYLAIDTVFHPSGIIQNDSHNGIPILLTLCASQFIHFKALQIQNYIPKT